MTRLLVGALLLAALGACGPQDVVVAFVPDGGWQPPRGPPCTSNADCPPFAFCDRASCGDPAGRCAQRPALCEPVGAPSCGCDGVSYLNDCYRRAQGITAATPGECTAGATCDAQTACPGQAFCARLLPACVPPASAGRCWWVPAACPGVGAFNSCAAAGCVELCAAVRSEQPHAPAATLMCP